MSISRIMDELRRAVARLKTAPPASRAWSAEACLYHHGQDWFDHWKRLGCSDDEARVAVRASCRPKFPHAGWFMVTSPQAVQLSRILLERERSRQFS